MDGIPTFRALQQTTGGSAVSNAELSSMVQRLQLQAGGQYELLPSHTNLSMQSPMPALVNNIGALGGFNSSGEAAPAGSWLTNDLSLLTSLSRGGQVDGFNHAIHPSGLLSYASNAVFDGTVRVELDHPFSITYNRSSASVSCRPFTLIRLSCIYLSVCLLVLIHAMP